MANAALRTLSMPVDNLAAQPVRALPGHFQIQFLTVWQCDWWQPARIPLTGLDAAIALRVNYRYEGCFLFICFSWLQRTQLLINSVCPCCLSLSLSVQSWCGVSVERATFGQTIINLDKGAHSWQHKKEERKKKANVELLGNGPDCNVVGLWAQS